MRTLLFLLLLNFAVAAKAQPVSVSTGDHEAFTRLVFTFPTQPDWSLVRTAAGYGLIVKGATPQYDLSAVYRRISTDRLKSIVWDDANALLLFDIACPCYAMPFELRAGILVIDIKDGQPPEGSSFEQTVAGEVLPPLTTPVARPAPREEVSTNEDLSDAIAAATRLGNQVPEVEPLVDPGLEGLRNDLLWQLSKGASKGVVEVAIPTTEPGKRTPAGANLGNIRIGDPQELDPNATDQANVAMTGAGAACWQDADLEVANWGGDSTVISDYASYTTGLVGEFDRPDPARLIRAVHYYLFLGFGAEARLLLNGLDIAAADRALLESMAHIVDLEPVPGTALAEMEGCNTNAALWAVLANSESPPMKSVAIPALLRAFSALPLHLRRHLGPSLAERFLQQDDAATARAIRDAILRAPGEHGASVDLLEAEIERVSGETAKAELILKPIVGTNGPAGLTSTISSILLYTDTGREVPRDLATTAEALLFETMGGPDESAIVEALARAYASQNRYGAAFGLLAEKAIAPAAVWRMLSETGSDTELLAFAVLSNPAEVPILPMDVGRAIAKRLITLGFPENALHWLSAASRNNGVLSEEDRLLIAEAELQQNDARAVIAGLDGLQTEAAERLRAQALAQLGDKGAAAMLKDIGLSSEAALAARHQGAWAEIAAIDENDLWKEAAALATGVKQPEEASDGTAATKGALATTRDLLDETAKARSLLEKLVSE
ncbi:hypothetical protein EGN72_02205 [Pseudorhodobacter sp. E13]|uniref:hypothetical protein n=1 Tax=Pseudorhodobacter sp. E13 TaxID=2487931 RepID=UPI000F8D5A7C|nr:hypothetical protein [Pseudorhodobacter sp. E13]RUS64918.1 hypothetical protein EGN72_02205 [Pseudorhodobacter sp. E13]